MAWLDAADIKERFNFDLADRENDSKINFASENAACNLEDWLTAEDFDMAKASLAPVDAADLRRYTRIVNAHAYLTVYHLFLTNTQIRSAGTVKNEKDLNDTTVSTAFLTPAEMERLRTQYLAQAKNLISAFAEFDFSAGAEIERFQRAGSMPVRVHW